MALRLVKNEECPRCGTAPWIWKKNRFAYQPQINICRGCELKELLQEEIEEGSHHGRFISLEKNALKKK